VARRTRVTTWYARQFGKVAKPGSERALADSIELPGHADFECSERPVGRAWVRRVAGRNLWMWYRFTAEEVLLLAVTTEPPVPVETGD
jgi:hypothetical protein